MANFGGILAGALGGLGGAAQGMAQGAIDDERKLTLSQQLSDMEEQRQQRIAEAGETRRRSGRQADFEQDLTNAPRATESAAASRRVTGAVDNELAGAREDASLAARSKADREGAAAFGRDPAAIAGTRARAQASDLGAGERGMRMAEMKDTAEQRREVRDLLRQAAEKRAGGDEDTAQQIEAQVRTLQGTGTTGKVDVAGVAQNAKNLLELAKSAEESGDMKGAKELRDEARRLSIGAAEKKLGSSGAGRPAEAPGIPANRVVGTTYQTPRGPLVWRGDGWEAPGGGGNPEKPKASTPPVGNPDKPEKPEYNPPPSSRVGILRAAAATRENEATAATEAQTKQAQQDFGALAGGDRAAARKLQTGPSFKYLTEAQQSRVYSIANGR